MTSKNKKDDDIDDAATKNVIDYYKKYSQNPDLPKYFSGSPLSYLPQFKEDIEEDDIPTIIIQTDFDLMITTEGNNEPENVSRASSAMSNKRLEWDNGADIGYDNFQRSQNLKKSSSLPIISKTNKQDHINGSEPILLSKETNSFNTDEQAEKVKLFIYTHSDSESPASVGGIVSSSQSSSSVGKSEDKRLITSCSSSSGGILEKQQFSSSESSSQKHLSDFVNTLSYLKKKIGLPGAQSTPYFPENDKNSEQLITDTPVVSNLEKRPKNVKTLLDKYQKSHGNDSTNDQSKSNNPASEKPVRNMEISKMKKPANLFITKPIFIECISSPKKSPKKETIKQSSIGIQTDPVMGKDLIQTIERHSVVVNQALEYCEHSDSDPNAVSTQTGSDMIESNCSSFKFIKKCEDQKVSQPNQQRLEGSLLPILINREPAESSDDISISSNILSEDIEKNTVILRKLLKSRKYDNSTKRHYIKKILQRIIESKYMEESSNSSELFLPKKTKTGAQNLAVPPSTDSSSKSLQEQNILQAYSQCSECHKSSPRKRKQSNRILTTEVKSTAYIEGGKIPTKEDEKLTTSNFALKGGFVDQNSTNMSNSTLEKQYEAITSSSSYSSKAESKHLSYQNWKEDKTHSEQLFEANPSAIGDGDYLTLLPNRRMEHQINWIDQEIDHLAKLKSLLKHRELKKRDSQTKLQKIKSVYVVSDDNDNSEGQKSDGSNTKYVIETNLATSSSSSKSRKYRIGDRNYTVKEISDSSNDQDENNKSHAVSGDIEVVSGIEGLNIKVTTFCESCKKSPCVCTTSLNKNNSKLKSHFSNSNKGSFLSRSTKSKLDTYTCCHKKTDSTKTILSQSLEHCPLCNLYNCNCSAKLSNRGESYEGQFIACEPSSRKTSSIIPGNQRYPSKSSVDVELPSQKQSSSTSLQRQTNIEAGSSISCTVCTKTPCQCESLDQGGSLKRVFENCSCKSKSTCDCGFVNKLYRHFKPSNEPKSEKIKPVMDSMGVQTESANLISTEIQACIDDSESVLPQLQTVSLSSEAVGVQTQIEMHHVGSQIIRDLKSCACQTQPEVVPQRNVEVEAKTNENLGVQVSLPSRKEQASQIGGKQCQSQYQQTEDESYRIGDIENVRRSSVDWAGKIVEGVVRSYSNSVTNTLKSDKEKSSRQKTIQSTSSVLNSVTSSTAISPYENSTATTTSSSSTAVCICCKKLSEKKEISIYRYDNAEYPLCSKCIKKKPILTTVCYTGPDYVCSCSQSEPDTPKEPQEYCTCIKPSHYKNSKYCAHCQFKLRRTLKSKNGIAYTLTLEYQSPTRHKSKRKKPKELEEIKVKIPCPYSKKRHKDKENFHRKERIEPEISNDYTNGSTTNRDSEVIDSTNDEARHLESVKSDEAQKTKSRRILTLQEHLIKNRPDFIDSAEYRRHALLNSRQDREVKKDEVRIRFLEENAKISKNCGSKLFTEREMREITKKNYKKLPEVQQKLRNNREQVLRKADKFIVNTFTKKIQKSILKGKSTFPIDTNIVNVYK